MSQISQISASSPNYVLINLKLSQFPIFFINIFSVRIHTQGNSHFFLYFFFVQSRAPINFILSAFNRLLWMRVVDVYSWNNNTHPTPSWWEMRDEFTCVDQREFFFIWISLTKFHRLAGGDSNAEKNYFNIIFPHSSMEFRQLKIIN